MDRPPADAQPRLVLHPGHGKCGSSTIQFALYSNIDQLERQGAFVPNRRFEFPVDGPAYRERLGNPVRYFDSLSDAAGLAGFETRLVESLAAIRGAGGRTVIISAENLGNQPGITARRPVHEILARHFADIHVVFYVRRQDEWMVSSWQQWGHKLGWSLERHIEKGIEDHRPDFLKAALLFEEVYGAGTVEVVPLVRQTLVEGDLLADFSERAGVARLELPEEQQFRNASFGSALCDVLSRIHGIYDGTREHTVRELLSGLTASRELVFSSDKRLLSPALRRTVLEHFRIDNERLRERFFPEVPFDVVFGLPEPEEDPELAELRAQIEGLRDVVAIQMDVILSLLDGAEGPKKSRSLLRRFAHRRRSSGE
jgi:hypothetical protein